MNEKQKLPIRDIVLIGMMIATIEVVKQALVSIPNVELVTFLIIIYTLYFGKRIFYALPAFALIECLIHGFGIWSIMYFYVWPILSIVVLKFRDQTSVWFWSIVAGLYGLLFGALCTIPYIVLTGWRAAFGWWIAGIPFDLVHGISNFLVCMVLFVPVSNAMKKVSASL